MCEVCEACQKPRSLKMPIESTPIPPAPMASVAMDLFSLPPVESEGVKYDMVSVCVDRHSGWIVAVPATKIGLTGAKVAKAMIQNQWRPFGIPSLITSDQGSQFVGSWWKTMCSILGIRHAVSHAYHHKANGRAERAGQQLFDRLRRIMIDEKISWVEALPQVLDRIHDTPGEGGFSPYEILFGRQRPLAGVPYSTPTECENSKEFFARQREVDRAVARVLNEKHAKQVGAANRGRVDPPALSIGDQIWYLRPPDSGNKLDSRWIGPGRVTAREGEHSYVIEIKPGS